jgi:type I restriction enzyme M protein
MPALSPDATPGLTEPTSTLLSEAIAQGATGHGLRFFRPELIQAVQLRRHGGVLQLHCLKRRRWLKAKPEEVVRQLALQWMTTDLGYPLSRIAVEWPIQMGSDAERERADVVIFSDDAQTDPFIIVEVKRPKVTEGVTQLESYLRWTGCFFGFWGPSTF